MATWSRLSWQQTVFTKPDGPQLATNLLMVSGRIATRIWKIAAIYLLVANSFYWESVVHKDLCQDSCWGKGQANFYKIDGVKWLDLKQVGAVKRSGGGEFQQGLSPRNRVMTLTSQMAPKSHSSSCNLLFILQHATDFTGKGSLSLIPIFTMSKSPNW